MPRRQNTRLEVRHSMTLNIQKILVFSCCISSILLTSCASRTRLRRDVDSSKTLPFPVSKSEFYYCEVDSELHRKMYPAIRLRAPRMPDHFEFILPTGGSVPGKCYMLALPGY